MECPYPEVPAEKAGTLNLGVALGENVAFGLVSGRSMAAQAAVVKRIREEKLYQALEPLWEEFCPKYLNMSRAEADRLIRLYVEFGPGYFDVSQLTRVSPETYRALSGAVRDGAIHIDGQSIELKAQNSREVAAAVARLRKTTRKTDPIGELQRLSTAFVQELQKAAKKEHNGGNWTQFTALFEQVQSELARIGAENSIGAEGGQQNG